MDITMELIKLSYKTKVALANDKQNSPEFLAALEKRGIHTKSNIER